MSSGVKYNNFNLLFFACLFGPNVPMFISSVFHFHLSIIASDMLNPGLFVTFN